MPWNVVKSSRCPLSRPWGVIGGASGDDLRGCHPTEDAARAQQAALYAAEEKALLEEQSVPGWADGMVAPSPRIVLP